ncbi:MAG: hypothetical protein V1789_02580 [PVC group bacterium]
MIDLAEIASRGEEDAIFRYTAVRPDQAGMEALSPEQRREVTEALSLEAES